MAFSISKLLAGNECLDGLLDFCIYYIYLMFYYAFLVSSLGPTSFAPMIEAAIRIVEQSGGQYHVLLIIADGQVANLLYIDRLSK